MKAILPVYHTIIVPLKHALATIDSINKREDAAVIALTEVGWFFRDVVITYKIDYSK